MAHDVLSMTVSEWVLSTYIHEGNVKVNVYLTDDETAFLCDFMAYSGTVRTVPALIGGEKLKDVIWDGILGKYVLYI